VVLIAWKKASRPRQEPDAVGPRPYRADARELTPIWPPPGAFGSTLSGLWLIAASLAQFAVVDNMPRAGG